MLGLGNSITSQSYVSSGLSWGATKFLDLPGEVGDFAKIESFSNFLGRISDSGGGDIADNLTVSFWVKPIWTMGNVGTNQHVLGSASSTNDFQSNACPLPVFGNTSTEKDRVRIFYLVDSSSGGDRNRLVIQAMDPSNNQQRDEVFLHSTNNSITGVGSTLTNSGITNGWWHTDNQGNVNSDDFVHLAFTRASGEFSIYWNGQVMGSPVDADSGTLGFTESNVDQFWLGRDFTNQVYFKMGYRDIAYFNAELSASEVAELYNSGNLFDVRTHSQSANLGLYWPCEDEQELSGAGVSANLSLQGNASFQSI